MISSIVVLLLVLSLFGIHGQDPNGNVNGRSQKNMKCYDEKSRPIRCVPEFVNAAFHRTVTSSNTCGTPRSTYCVQTLATGQRKQCQICDSSIKKYSHPSIYITDIKDDKNYSWWQSDSLYTLGKNKIYDPVTRRARVVLELDLGKTFDVVSIRLRFRSLRPESMAIFKRTTADANSPWIPYQFYSRSCREMYGSETDGIITRDNLQSALCTARYSQLTPISGGEVLFRTLANRPGRDEIEKLPALQDWIRAYSLRFDLDRLNTYGDDLFGDPKVLRSYYYAIIDLTVVGKCDCNGHASECIRRENSGRQAPLVCKCEHFTDGVDCEKCLPFYNNKPWAKATSTNANPCEGMSSMSTGAELRDMAFPDFVARQDGQDYKICCSPCDCNGLADVCEFDKRLYERTGRGGRCVGCRNNTGGDFCERCEVNYHRENPNEVCKPCNCNPIGSQTLQCHTDGRCYCKPGVTGDKCDRCRANHYGFSEDGCSPCQCSVLGTRQDSFQCGENGECTCKKNVFGKNCDKCLPGFFALEADNPYGCRACFCYGHSNDCKSAGGVSRVNLTSVFRFGFEGWTALNSKGEDVTRQHGTWDQPKQYVRVTSINQDSIYLSAPVSYLKDKKTSYSRVLAFSFKVADTTDMQFTQNDIIFEAKDNLRISTSLTAQGNPVPTRSFQRYRYRLHEDPSFDWMPKLSAFDFQRLLNDITQIKIRMTYSGQGTGFIDDVSLEFARNDDNAVDSVNWMEQCHCPPSYVGLSCQECKDGHKHETINGSSYDRCVPCECNNHAEKCDPDTGKCVCLDNTVGDHCARCKDGFYGNPTIGNKDDCKPCPCVVGNQCIQIGVKVKCVCEEPYQGDLCDRCSDGFYGDPAGRRGPKTLCVKCDCSGNIDTNAVFNCDSETGDCNKCIYNSRNGPLKQCERCKLGYYGDATEYPKPGCKACNCHENGTFTATTTNTSQPLSCDREGQCLCRENVVGDKCDQCRPEYWNINSRKGCEPCACSSIGSYNNTCDMHSGQCICKPGVGGRRCDQCLPDHYKFTSDGCRACNCNSDGSLTVSCDDNGRCECRPGVLGIKCDQCGENRFNLSAGCIRCPPCYDELKIKVDKLRNILNSLNSSNSSSGTTDQNPDEAFLKDLNDMKQKLLILLNEAEDTSVSDNELMKRLDVLNKTLFIIEAHLETAHINTTKATRHQQGANAEVNLAVKSIQNSWELLKQIGTSANNTGKILEQISNSIRNWSVSTVSLKEIAQEIRNLANEQWDEVNRLQKIANKSLEDSKEAGEITDRGFKLQDDTVEQMTLIDNNLNDVKSLGEMALGNATEAKDHAEKTVTEAENLLEKARIPLENVDVNTTKENARETTKEAKNVQEEARRLAGLTTESEGDVDQGLLKQKKTKIYHIENRTIELLKEAQEANTTAHFAIVNGTKALNKARNTLKILQDFSKMVNESKLKAEEAKNNIPEIKRLIASANNKTSKAVEEVGDAENDVQDAVKDAEEASRVSAETTKKAQELLERAKGLVVPDDSVYTETKKAEEKVGYYEEQAYNNEQVVANATKMANDSKDLAASVMKTIENARYAIIELSSQISDIPDLDYDLLEKLETAIDGQKKLDQSLESKITLIKEREKKIETDIEKYKIDLSELERALKSLERNRQIIPDYCLKPADTPS